MQKLQVALLNSYGWKDKQIADFLKIPKSSVPMFLADVAADGTTFDITPNGNTELVPTNELGNDMAYTDGVRNLKTREVGRLQVLAPIIASIEMSLYQKVMEAVKHVEGSDVKAISEVISMYKKLSADSVVNVVKNDKEAGGNATANIVVAMKFQD